MSTDIACSFVDHMLLNMIGHMYGHRGHLNINAGSTYINMFSTMKKTNKSQ